MLLFHWIDIILGIGRAARGVCGLETRMRRGGGMIAVRVRFAQRACGRGRMVRGCVLHVLHHSVSTGACPSCECNSRGISSACLERYAVEYCIYAITTSVLANVRHANAIRAAFYRFGHNDARLRIAYAPLQRQNGRMFVIRMRFAQHIVGLARTAYVCALHLRHRAISTRNRPQTDTARTSCNNPPRSAAQFQLRNLAA